MGDGFDKLDVNPASSKYGKVINKVSVRGQGEAHHMGFTETGTRAAPTTSSSCAALPGTARSSSRPSRSIFYKEKLGRAHHMKLGSKAMKTAYGGERTAALR